MKYAIALALMTTAAHAQTVPPPEYDRPYRGHLTVERIATHAALLAACRRWAGSNIIGCAYRSGDSCRVVIVTDNLLKAANSTRARIMRHELGHCNGWPGDHPGARPLVVR